MEVGGSPSVTSVILDSLFFVSYKLRSSGLSLLFTVIYLDIFTKYCILNTKLKKGPSMRSVEMHDLAGTVVSPWA